MDAHLHSPINSQEISLAICLIMGALHALEPGHGKTAFVAHLLTEKKNYLRPLALALTTSITHAASILIISLLVHGLLHTAFSIETSAVVEGMNLISGIILIGLGLYIFAGTKKTRAPLMQFSEVSPSLSSTTLSSTTFHGSGCACPTHRLQSSRLQSSTSQNSNKTWRTIAIGFAVGLIPCPSALAALSTALASEDLSSTVLIISMFSLGIFLSLTMAGSVIARYSSKVLGHSFSKNRPYLASHIQTAVFLATGAWHISMFAA